MSHPKLLTVSLVLAFAAAGCSTMDDVNVSHACNAPVSVTIAHIFAPSGDTERTDQATVPPTEGTLVAGFVNMNADDIVHLMVDVSGWEIELTRDELRTRDGVITLPPEACP